MRGLSKALVMVICGVVTACGTTTTPTTYSTGLRLIVDHTDAPATDTIQVFVCEVPLPTTDALFGDLPLRLTLDPGTIAGQLDLGVGPYFDELSHGRYRPHFTAGATLTMSADETHDQCVEDAVDASAPAATVVLVVATAENRSDMSGGWGRPGTACAADPCSASITRRAVYVGASDFNPDNGDMPLLDLVEHEIGHTLDLAHSGGAGAQYESALDVMSNSAAPRLAQPERRNAQDTIAVDRLALGWLPTSSMAVATAVGGRFALRSSTGETGQRLLVLPIDDLSFLTVEFLGASGLDDFLPASGIAVHRIDQAPSSCGRAAADAPCAGVDRRQITLGSPDPHTELLHVGGQSWDVDGWTVTLLDTPSGPSATVQVEVHPTDR